MDLDKLDTTDRILAGCGLGLVIDLLFFPWHSVDLGPFGSVTRNATESPNGFWGVLALLLAVLVTAVTLVRAFKPETQLPELPIPLHQAIFYASAATAGILVLKLIMETEGLGFGSYLGVLLGGGLAYGGFQKNKDGSDTPPAPTV